MKRALLVATLAAVAGLAACATTDAPVTVSPKGNGEQAPPPSDRLAARPFITVTDALEKVWLPGGSFDIGAETVFAPIHSGLHATLFYVAMRGEVPRHVHRAHEETLFVYEGTGTLLLAGERTKPLEAGTCVRIPPGVCHGYKGSRADPIKAFCVVSPALESDDFVAQDHDDPGLLDKVWIGDPTSTTALEALPANPDSTAVRKRLHSSRYSTLQVAAVRRDVIPDHQHANHDETVFIFALAGFGFMRLNEVVHVVQPGSIAHVPAGTTHGFQHQAEGHARAISIFTPGYDGTDFQEIHDKAVPEAPKGYKVQEWGEFHDQKPTAPTVIKHDDGK